MKNIFVFGWYGHNNLGDEAFKKAFESLWGRQANLTFKNKIPDNINEYDACFIGGGSFLDQEIPNLSKIKIPLAFIGVGVHSYIHPKNMPSLHQSKLIITRDEIIPECLSDINSKIFKASDLVFSRKLNISNCNKDRSILVLGNEFLSPKRNSPNWKHTSFNWFISEFSKVCDDLAKEGYLIKFYPMCTSDKFDDRFFSSHIASQMETNKFEFHFKDTNEDEFINNINQAHLVISMRFHGNIFSTILGKNFVGINSHDKMKSYFNTLGLNNFVDYYGFNSSVFRSCIENNQVDPSYLLDYSDKEKSRWRYLSGIVAEKFIM